MGPIDVDRSGPHGIETPPASVRFRSELVGAQDLDLFEVGDAGIVVEELLGHLVGDPVGRVLAAGDDLDLDVAELVDDVGPVGRTHAAAALAAGRRDRVTARAGIFDELRHLLDDDLLGNDDDLAGLVVIHGSSRAFGAWWLNARHQSPNTASASAMYSGMPMAMATGVPTLVDEPMYDDGLAEGIAACSVGGPEMSELEPAITASSTTPPGLKPVR